MNTYDIIMAPLEALLLKNIRTQIIPLAFGDVLEAGIGTGVNFPYYDYPKIHALTGMDLEYDQELESRRLEKFHFAKGSIEQIPFPAQSFDTVVTTLLLCTVDVHQSICEVQRVLRPGGLFVFIEHVRPESKVMGQIFDFLNKGWPKVAHGCNLNHRTDIALEHSGFSDLHIQQRWGGVFCYGSARKGL